MPDFPALDPVLTPHYNLRKPQMLIIHGTEVDDSVAQHILSGKAGIEASCHYYIRASGEVIPYLDEATRAWHAGAGFWSGYSDINSLSVGIELEALSKNRRFDGHDTVYTAAQMQALVPLAKAIIERQKIAPCHVLGHQDVSCTRPYEPVVADTIEEMARDYPLGQQKKYDPGPFFNWKLLAENGVGLWHDMDPADEDPALDDPADLMRFRMNMIVYGYDMRGLHGDYANESAIRAFQTHFMPWNITGKATVQSLAIITRLMELKLA